MESRPSFRERIGLKKKKTLPSAPVVERPDSSSPLLLAPDSWVWDVASPLGVSSSGVAGGSLAAKAVAIVSTSGSATAVASTLQTIGAATLASPAGLCLVTSCAIVGGTVLVGKTLFVQGATPKMSDDAWILIEATDLTRVPTSKNKTDDDQFSIGVFDTEDAARKAFKRSRVRSRALFAPGKTLVQSRQWQETFRQVVAAM